MSDMTTIPTIGYARQRVHGDFNYSNDYEMHYVEHQEALLPTAKPEHHIPGMPDRVGFRRFKTRFLRKGRKKIGVAESLQNLATSSFLNLFLVFLPISWVLRFTQQEYKTIIFATSFLAIIPLERLFDYCGEQMEFYVGQAFGDLIVITLNNAVEATLAVILLLKHKYRVMQSTLIGVLILHLLLIPGTAFLTGGARIASQELQSESTELNHTLLMLGVLSIVVPAAFFAALDRGVTVDIGGATQNVLTDQLRDNFLRFSRGISIVLLVMYICSRIYLHDPPPDNNADPRKWNKLVLEHEKKLAHEDPEVNQWVCIVVIIVAVGLMAATAEFLVESIEHVSLLYGGRQEWFGLILLPVVSFAADGTVAALYFLRSIYTHFFQRPLEPISLAKARTIDLSIQFTLFWIPLFILIAWWTNRPLTLLFDLFEVVILVGACFLVNYVTADGKTNWAEGFAMISFYVIIALCAWYYPGQPEVALMLSRGTIADAIANGGAKPGAH